MVLDVEVVAPLLLRKLSPGRDRGGDCSTLDRFQEVFGGDGIHSWGAPRSPVTDTLLENFEAEEEAEKQDLCVEVHTWMCRSLARGQELQLRGENSMWALGLSVFGGPEVLGECLVPRPTAREMRPRDLLVLVHAVSVNPVDCHKRQNFGVRARGGGGVGRFLILGYDGSGVVEKTGASVERGFQAGDRVIFLGDLNRQGANAEYVLVDERMVARKPPSLSFAVCVPLCICLFFSPSWGLSYTGDDLPPFHSFLVWWWGVCSSRAAGNRKQPPSHWLP